MTNGVRRWVPWAVILLAGAGCIQLSSNPTEITGITFDVLPWPSVVAGDTLRDSTGVATPLTARFYDGAGAQVPDVPATFFSRDATVTIGDGNFLVGGDETDASARLVASGAGLQSVEQKIEIVARPDSLAADGAVTPLQWSVPDSPTANTSAPIKVRVLHVDPVGDTTGVRSWVVTFHLEYRGVAVPATDTSEVFLVNDVGRPSTSDTTDTQGSASRKVRVRVVTGTPADSVVVIAEAAYAGTPLAGSSLRLVLPLSPKGAAAQRVP